MDVNASVSTCSTSHSNVNLSNLPLHVSDNILYQRYLSLVQDWWDSSSEAGPKTRPASEFGEAPPGLSSLSTADGCLQPRVVD